MIINHNMAALNTYNRLSANNSQTSKSLEKLSSGLRINRAGDDAAGLAISEKMRGQIRGLDQASRNAQDAVSLLQTAEGNLNETHSILQRMKELATQAANDTNVGVDRNEIQKEINQLSSEINRIGNTTEFNKQLLLNGGTQVTTNSTPSGVRMTGGTANALTNATANGSAGTAAEAAVFRTGALDVGAGVQDNETFTFGGVTVTLSVAADADHVAGSPSVVAGYSGTAVTLNVASADATDATTIRDGLLAAFNAAKSVVGSPVADITFAADGVKGLMATDTLANGNAHNAWLFASTSANASFANADAAAQTAAGNAGVDGAPATSVMTFAGVAQEGSSIIMADKKIAFWNSGLGNFKDANEAMAVLKADYVVDVNGLADGDADAMGAKILSTIGSTGISGWTLSTSASGAGHATDVVTLTANTPGVFQGHNRGQVVDVATSTQATGSFTFTDSPAEGSYIEIGGQKIGFYDSSKGNYASDAAARTGIGADFAVDVKGLSTEQVVDKLVSMQDSLNNVFEKDLDLAKVVNTDGSVDLKLTAQTAGFGGNTITLSKSALTTSGFKANLQIGANTSQSMTLEFSDMRADALKITNETTGTITASNGKVASYVAVANVTNGSDNENVEYSLDVSDHKKASAAISVIEDAIEAVSAERSKMGAYQNRLEHTINNLGTSSENLTAAESRIRDVDMAKEMMNFQKNNILSQAAQAMLAQANQQPQGVLQLLR